MIKYNLGCLELSEKIVQKKTKTAGVYDWSGKFENWQRNYTKTWCRIREKYESKTCARNTNVQNSGKWNVNHITEIGKFEKGGKSIVQKGTMKTKEIGTDD